MLTRKLISIFFLLTLLVNVNYRFLVVMDYSLNESSYSQNCENKARPQLECNGKCAMVKKMNLDDESKANGSPTSKNENRVLLLFSSPEHFIYNSIVYKQAITLYGCAVSDKKMNSSYLSEIFKPPCA